MQDLYLLKDYSNYFNRKVRRKDTLAAYLGATSDNYLLANANFSMGDGITATHTIGSQGNPYDNDWCPDYCLVVDHDTSAILSRWYVTDFIKNMGYQYTMTLKRDVLSDYYEQVLSAPCFIEKGHLQDNDPMIVNSEGMALNQIKMGEYYLKDKTKVPWIIVYLNQARADDWDDIESKYVPDTPSTLPVIEDDPVMSSVFIESGNLVINKQLKKMNSISIKYNGTLTKDIFFHSISWICHNEWSINGMNSGHVDGELDARDYFELLVDSSPASPSYGDFNHVIDNAGNNIYADRTNVENSIKALYNNYNLYTYNKMPILEKNKLWYSRTTNKVYKLDFSDSDLSVSSRRIEDSGLINLLYNKFSTYGNCHRVELSSHKFFNITIKGTLKDCHLVENATNVTKGTIKKTANHCLDVPYDIIAIPLGSIDVYENTTLKASNNTSAALNFARTLILGGKTPSDKVFGGTNIYDVQILPYCPIQTGIVDNAKLDISKGSANGDYALIVDKNDATKVLSIMLFSSYASTTFDISSLDLDIFESEQVNVSDILKISDRKIQNECELYRLVSPNVQGMFDFNIAKAIPIGLNSISTFNIDITFRPYNPYIHINPDFGFLYGADYNDSRGLICGGDFSISSISSAWTNYMINNKNYQNIFDRQISHMETMRGFEREGEMWNLITGGISGGLATIGGAAAGAAGGSIIPGLGTVAGAIVGGAVAGGRSALGIAGKVAANERAERAYRESVSYTRDMFNMQLDNIKAQPNSLTKVSTLSYNYKFFPVLEIYSCTDEERNAVENKIKYNGMTVGRIDNISNFIDDTETRFVKGQMIRLEDLGFTSHVAMDIYDEINKGIFFVPKGA